MAEDCESVAEVALALELPPPPDRSFGKSLLATSRVVCASTNMLGSKNVAARN